MGTCCRIVRCFVFLALLALLLAVASAGAKAQTGPCSTGTGVCVLTWQQDTGLNTTCVGCVYHTGENLSEPTLTASVLQTQNFGVLCAASLDGQVFGQPLVVTNVTINNVTYGRVVYVVTQKDTLYAIDGNPTDNPPCQILNGNGSGTSLLGSGQYEVDCNHIGAGPESCANTIGPYVGILSTPVIQISGTTGTIYLVTEVQNCDPQTECDPETWGHFLHAVDIQTFADQNIQIYPPGEQSGASTFSQSHIQRPGLLYLTASQTGLTQDTVYVSFSMMDGAGIPAPNGAIFGYDPSNLVQSATPFYFQTSEGVNQNDGGGIWGGGAPPAFGSSANGNLLYLTTGNSTVGNTQTIHTWHDSFLTLDPDLTMPTTGTPYFTPVDQFYRSDASCNPPDGNDRDYGSGSVMLIPDHALPGWPYMAVNGDKEGGLWFVNRSNPGGHNTQCDLPTPTCTCTPSGSNPSGNVQTVWTGTPYAGHGIHTGMAFWNRPFGVATEAPYIYFATGSGALTRYQLCGNAAIGPVCNNKVLQESGLSFPSGTTPAISAASPTALDAVVWVTAQVYAAQPTGCSSNPQPGCGGTLEAFDAVTLQNLYSNHTCLNRDALAPTSKYSIATVANGNVYLGTHAVDSNGNPTSGGMFYIFGPNAATCSSSINHHSGATTTGSR
jgi:hypothetical protein